MDAAKAIGLAVANDKHPRQLVGYFRGWHAPAPIYAVPTTAGTGSEVTVAAVISDPETNTKLVIADTRLVPGMAALDPCLMTGLPRARHRGHRHGCADARDRGLHRRLVDRLHRSHGAGGRAA